MKNDTDLKNAGFTDSGIIRYRNTVQDYCESIYDKAVSFGDKDKMAGAQREVTHEHVRNAALEIATQGRNSQTPLQVICQVVEYLCAATTGVGGGNLNTQWGILLFGLGLALGVILFVWRNTRK